MRRLLVLASAVVFLDIAFFSAIAPLLPDYVDDLGLSAAQAGILSASYATGTLLASLPGGFVASRLGPRTTVIVGLCMLGIASVVFGFAGQIVLLDAARFTQGVAGSLIWIGAISWLVSVAPVERRGSVIGTTLGTAVAGALLGPALGALAGSVGTEPVFSSVLVVSLFLALLAARLPDAETRESQNLVKVGPTLITPPVIAAFTFVAVPSLMFGAVEVLVPLRIDSLGGSHAVIAAGFIVGAALEAGLAPLAGRFSDRRGRRAPYVGGLAVCVVAMVALALAASLGMILVSLILASVGAGLCFAPAMALISDIAAKAGLHQGYAAALTNLSWATGQVVGGIGGGVAASLTAEGVPSALIVAILVPTIIYALRTVPIRATAETAEA
ncbi:MAG: MFS transporter [Solirubrobacterales bacterium]